MTTADLLCAARAVKPAAAALSTAEKNRLLEAMAQALLDHADNILAANAADVEAARGVIAPVMIDRLSLSPARVESMAEGMRAVAALPDPVGELLSETARSNGLVIRKVRVPMGVIAIIYESRPNVTADAAALCLKSGNVCVLRGGKEAIRSNTAVVAVLEASAEIAERLARGGAWHIMDTGHMLMFEGVGRTGGMMAVKPIRITCEIQNPVRHRPAPARGIVGYDTIPGFADYVLGRANVLPDDVIMIGSVSGYQYFPVDLALKANEMGCATVAVTSVEYSGHLTGKHPSGKRLFEACTYCLDNCTNYGDTLVDVPALGQRICPASGISASYLMWAVQSTVVEKLLEKGLKPSVYISNHMPDAARINGEALENYEKYGF